MQFIWKPQVNYKLVSTNLWSLSAYVRTIFKSLLDCFVNIYIFNINNLTQYLYFCELTKLNKTYVHVLTEQTAKSNIYQNYHLKYSDINIKYSFQIYIFSKKIITPFWSNFNVKLTVRTITVLTPANWKFENQLKFKNNISLNIQHRY